MAYPRTINNLPFGGSTLIVDFDKEPPFEVNNNVALSDGSSHVTVLGWKQYATITYHWASPEESRNLVDLPIVGLNTLIPKEEGWSYDEPTQEQIAPTIHLYNITVRATWFGPKKPAT